MNVIFFFFSEQPNSADSTYYKHLRKIENCNGVQNALDGFDKNAPTVFYLPGLGQEIDDQETRAFISGN